MFFSFKFVVCLLFFGMMIFFVLCLIWFFKIIILTFRIRGGVEDIRLEAKAKNTTQKYPRPRADPLEAKDRNAQARSQEFEMGGLFWRLEATSNDLDPGFNRSSLRLSPFFCPNFKKVILKKTKTVFSQAQFVWS